MATVASAIQSLNSGNILAELDDGVYDNSSPGLYITKSMCEFRAKNEGKAILKGYPFGVKGSSVKISGFDMQFGDTTQTMMESTGNDVALIKNKIHFQNKISTRQDWIVSKGNNFIFEGNELYNRVGMGNPLLMWGLNPKILSNHLHDFSGGSGNGAELIRLAASDKRLMSMKAEIAYNTIENHNTSDDELITVKCCDNDIHDNLIQNCRASPSFRHGRNNKFRCNKLFGTGFRMYGKGHIVTGNQFIRNPNSQLLQIVFGNGDYAEEEQNTTAGYTQVRDVLFAGNWIDGQDSTTNILVCLGYGSRSFKPVANTIRLNTITASKGILANTKDGAKWTDNAVSDNVLLPTALAKMGDMPISGYKH